jgi:hypothetical protein
MVTSKLPPKRANWEASGSSFHRNARRIMYSVVDVPFFLFCTRVREGRFCISKAVPTALNERFHTIKFLCRVVVLLKSRRNEEAGQGGEVSGARDDVY